MTKKKQTAEQTAPAAVPGSIITLVMSWAFVRAADSFALALDLLAAALAHAGIDHAACVRILSDRKPDGTPDPLRHLAARIERVGITAALYGRNPGEANSIGRNNRALPGTHLIVALGEVDNGAMSALLRYATATPTPAPADHRDNAEGHGTAAPAPAPGPRFHVIQITNGRPEEISNPDEITYAPDFAAPAAPASLAASPLARFARR